MMNCSICGTKTDPMKTDDLCWLCHGKKLEAENKRLEEQVRLGCRFWNRVTFSCSEVAKLVKTEKDRDRYMDALIQARDHVHKICHHEVCSPLCTQMSEALARGSQENQ